MGVKRGRPLKKVLKDKTLKFRYDAEIERKLEEICAETGKTKSQVIRDGINKQYAEIEKE